MTKVLISDKLASGAAKIFHDAGIEVDVRPGLSLEELGDIIGDYDGLAIRSATKVTPELLDKAPRLKVIGRAGIGVDNVDIAAATAAGVVVMNTPFGNAVQRISRNDIPRCICQWRVKRDEIRFFQ